MDVLIRRLMALALAVAGVSFSATGLEAQRATAPQLTAAFLFNFVKFTTWPAEALPAEAPLVVCVSHNDAVANSLDELTQNQTVAGHRISIRRTGLDQALHDCQVLYAAGLDDKRARQLIGAIAGRPILTVSDASDFAQRGGVANFFVDKGRMRFAVNPQAADRAGLRISSKLLSLSKIVKDQLHASSP